LERFLERGFRQAAQLAGRVGLVLKLVETPGQTWIVSS
jgi:hypothetical protein